MYKEIDFLEHLQNMENKEKQAQKILDKIKPAYIKRVEALQKKYAEAIKANNDFLDKWGNDLHNYEKELKKITRAYKKEFRQEMENYNN